MLQHHHFGPDEERPLGLRARRGRLPSVRTGDPPSRSRLREYDDGTSHSHSGSGSSIFQLDLVAKNGLPKLVTCNRENH